MLFRSTGNALELFGKRIENEDGTSVETLGLFELYSKRQMMNRYSSIYLGMFGAMSIVGFKSQFAHIYDDGEGSVPALFQTLRGGGRKPGQTEEGVRINNFYATNLLGPLLLINPLFSRYILSLLGAGEHDLPCEQESMIAYEARLREFKDPKTGTEYH